MATASKKKMVWPECMPYMVPSLLMRNGTGEEETDDEGRFPNWDVPRCVTEWSQTAFDLTYSEAELEFWKTFIKKALRNEKYYKRAFIEVLDELDSSNTREAVFDIYDAVQQWFDDSRTSLQRVSNIYNQTVADFGYLEDVEE